MSNILIGSSNSIEGITKIINQYFYSSNASVELKDKELYIIKKGEKVLDDYIVVKKGKHFRFEEIKVY